MKTGFLLVIAALIAMISCNRQQEQQKSAPERLLRHVVLFSFNETATADEIRAVEEAFAALPGKIDVIHDFEWGTDLGISNIARGYSHCFLLTFKSRAGLDAYDIHPDHQELISIGASILENVLVIDYWTD